MAEKIKTFTEAQWAEVREAQERWRRVESSTEPVDRPKVERLISALYAKRGYRAPKFLWWDGPLAAGVLTPLFLSRQGSLGCKIHVGQQLVDAARLHHQLAHTLYGPLRARVVDRLNIGALSRQFSAHLSGRFDLDLATKLRLPAFDASLAVRFTDPLYGNFGDQLYAQCCTHPGIPHFAGLFARLADQLGKSLDELPGVRSWLADPEYGFKPDTVELIQGAEMLRTLGLEFQGDTESLELLVALTAERGAWNPFARFCICVDRPNVLSVDQEGRLHSETGPALAYGDGFQLYSWHGTGVPADWIEKKSELDPATLLQWPNIEQRRAAIEIMGWAKVLATLNTTVVDQDPNPEIGTLLYCVFPHRPHRRQFLQVKCGTGREFVLPVPPEVTSAREANAWTYGLNESEYRLEVRT